MPDFGIFRGFNEKLFGDKLVAGQLPTQLGLIGSEDFGFIGLLDDYPNAAAAYSLRLLRSAYTGSAIRVRRAVGSPSEKDIGFVNNELDVADLESFCSGTDGFVVTWYDQSGNGYNATQTTASSQPKIVSSGSTILDNGKPCIQFDGSDDYMQTSSVAEYSNQLEISIITVNKHTSTSSNMVYSASNNGMTFGTFDDMIFYLTDRYYFINRNISGSQQNISIIDSNNKQVNEFASIVNSTTASLSINGNVTTNSTLDIATPTSNNNVFIGTRSGGIGRMIGNIQEVILYPSDQSSNRSGIETNINNHYNIY